ncbi:hypothetical protein [Haliangium sp.]|uniref:hypothetical protein n=1 Tax=Haliangium sp. TaxID=2663208 RepID=UPI003D0EAF93
MTKDTQTASSRSLVEALVEAGYRGLFMSLGSDRVDELWNEHGLAGFSALLADPAIDDQARFLAAEVVYRVNNDWPENAPLDLLAAAYAAALANDYIGAANPWGLPETLGVVSLHVLEMGQAATPHFLALLDDDTPVQYAGSEGATIGNRYRYRVKDIAAFLVSCIEMSAYGVSEDPDERDRRIEALRERLVSP